METSDIQPVALFAIARRSSRCCRFSITGFSRSLAHFSMRVEEIDINRTDAPSHDVLAVAEEKRDQVMSLLS